MVNGTFLTPDWSAPAAVRAWSTTRLGGVSTGAWASLNLSLDVKDDAGAVARNRALVHAALDLPSEPRWLKQVHGARVVEWSSDANVAVRPEADASTTMQSGVVCAVLTADCLPVLLCDARATRVAAVHAGWRGLAGGVVDAAVASFPAVDEVMAWLGPAIGPDAFEVGDDVRDTFLRDDAGAHTAFRAGVPGKWFADLYALASRRLQRLGVTRIYGGGACTYTDAQRYYSYRRDGETGRMATLIWLERRQ